MSGSVRNYFKDYIDTKNGFNMFHNQVINMPRDAFEGSGLSKLQILASYLLLLEKLTKPDGNSYKEIMELIANVIVTKVNDIKYRDIEFEKRYLASFDDLNIHYEKEGRMFRHLMGLCAFWGMIKSLSKDKKVINFDICKDFLSLQPDQILLFTSNMSFKINMKNDFIQNLKSIKIQSNANYHPTSAILKYMNEIGREVTDFEISVLLGRVDSMQDDDLILQRALDIGRWFNSTTRNGQQQQFFKEMGWIERDVLFSYSSSQQPWFKFQTYILFLENFKLIEKNPKTGNYNLTEYGQSLLGDLPASFINLDKLINDLNLDGGNISDITMKDVLIKTNLDTLEVLLADQELIKKINRFIIDNPKEKTGKRHRNQFIAELARIRENYKCQAGTTTFERQDGRNYVEVHHIIEFGKNGPDVLDNLLVLGPTPHAQLHRGSERAIKDMYVHLMNLGAIKLELFEKMIDDYNCLDAEHLDFLYIKGLISSSKKNQLQDKIATIKLGIDN